MSLTDTRATAAEPVALDAEGSAVHPAKLWNDTESAPDAGWLVKQLPGRGADWAAAVGSVPVHS